MTDLDFVDLEGVEDFAVAAVGDFMTKKALNLHSQQLRIISVITCPSKLKTPLLKIVASMWAISANEKYSERTSIAFSVNMGQLLPFPT